MTKHWQEFEITFSSNAEALLDELMAAAASMPNVCGCEQTGKPEETTRPGWRLYLEGDADTEQFTKRFLELASAMQVTNSALNGPRIVERQNWHDSWRQYFRPVYLGRRLAIVPSWDDEAKRRADDERRITLRLEPGMAFGTGTHATTQLCLEIAEEQIIPGSAVLDIGTGSGILAIAAVKMGADFCLAVDNDPEIEENFFENCRLNGITTDQVKLAIGVLEPVSEPVFDFIFCNMLLHEFTPLLPLLGSQLRPGGILLLSGLLETEHQQVRCLLQEAGLREAGNRTAGEWTALTAVHA